MKKLVKNKASGSQELPGDDLNKYIRKVNNTKTVLLKTLRLIHTIITGTPAMVGITIATSDIPTSVA